MEQVVLGHGISKPLARPYSAARFKYGGVALPPWLEQKRQIPFFYGGEFPAGYSYYTPPAVWFKPQMTLDIDRDSHFLCEGIGLTQPTRGQIAAESYLMYYWTFQVTDLTSNFPWSNIEIPRFDIAGGEGSYALLKDPVLIRPSTILQLNATMTAAHSSERTLYYTFYGRKIYGVTQAEENFFRKKHWYQYALELPELPKGSALRTTQLPIFADSDFILKRLSASSIFVNIASVNDTINHRRVDILLNIRDTATDRSFFSKKISIRSIAGGYLMPVLNTNTGWYHNSKSVPFEFDRPIFIPRNSKLEITMENPDTTTDLNAGPAGSSPGILTFEGIRVFD